MVKNRIDQDGQFTNINL